MDGIRVVLITRPKRDRYIPEGNYGYTKSEDGSPAMRFRWKGTFHSGNVELFLFATQSERFGIIDSKELAHIAKSLKKPVPYLGLLPSIAVEAWRAIPTKTKATKSFGVVYSNPEGHVGSFFAIAPSDVVDEIVAVVPPDKVSDDSKPKD
jgi:hypothetical protein